MSPVRNFLPQNSKHDISNGMSSRGAILIVTLWILAILVLFVLGLGFRMSLEAKLTGYNIKTFKLFYIAKAAVNSLKAALSRDETSDYDSLNEDWSNNEELFKEVRLGEELFAISYVRKEGFSEKIFYGAIDEQSKININNINEASRDILVRLLNLSGITGIAESEDIANSILDWIDDEVPDATRDGGAESIHYLSLEHPYPCKNGPFQSKEELLLVKGMTPEILSDIKDVITIYGDGKVNLNTADSRTLEALGLDYNKIISYRAGPDGEEGTDDDDAFKNVSEAINSLGLTASEALKVNNLNSAGLLGVGSNYFRAHVMARATDARTMKRVEAVVSRLGERRAVEFWYEY